MFDIYEMPLFEGCNKTVAEKILEKHPGRYAVYEKGDFIALQGYPCKTLFLLCEGGAYARMVSEEGKEFILDTLHAPEALASPFIFSTDRVFPVTIIASEACSIWILGRDALAELMEKDRAILHNFLRIISDHSMFLSRRLNEFALQSLSSRIVSYIERYGAIENLQETAFILGVARPSLSRAIAQLVAQGTLVKSGSSYDLDVNHHNP